MQPPTKLNWAAIVAEAVAITTSILLAFAIDAWWEDRQLRRDEQQVLMGLQREFDSIRQVLLTHQ